MPHQLACRIDVSSFDQEQGGKGSVANLFEGLILPYFCLYMVSACKINKKKQAYNTFATNLQQKKTSIPNIPQLFLAIFHLPNPHSRQIISIFQKI